MLKKGQHCLKNKVKKLKLNNVKLCYELLDQSVHIQHLFNDDLKLTR